MGDFDSDSPEDRLVHEAEDLMRQKRYQDAVSRYQDLRRFSPTDLWASLGHASALECAGEIPEAEQILEEATSSHRRSAALHRFRRMFFERREDMARAAGSQAALASDLNDEGPEDQLADLYFNQGRYHEARAELERLLREGRLEEDELKASVLMRVGACLRQSGDCDGAREHLLEALALEPGHHWVLAELAETERAAGNVEAARRRYHQALEANGDDQWCRGHLAQLEHEHGDDKRAIALYREILSAKPKEAWAKVELAQVLGESDVVESDRLCQSALDDDPAFPWAHAQLGNLARRTGNFEKAREHYLKALACAPQSVWVMHELADCCRHLGSMPEAFAHLEHARSLDPYDATTYGYFADLLRSEGKTVRAQAHLEKAVELDEGYTWAWRELSELRALDGRHAQAEEAYRRAVALEPDEAINHGLKAFLLRCAGRRDAALPHLELAAERDPTYFWAWREQIDYHLGRGAVAAAEACARRALTAIPDSPPLLGLLAETLRRQGKRAEARGHLVRAIAQAPGAAQLWALQAELSVEDDDHDDALHHVERACALDNAVEYRALKAQVLFAAGRTEEAGRIAQALADETRPLPAVFELLAAIAERDSDFAAAVRWCDRGLALQSDEPRLLVRRARLALTLGDNDAPARLAALDEHEGPLPWREVAQLYAQAGRAVAARRAAYRALATVEAHERPRAWLHLAEIELTLGNGVESQQALERALAGDTDLVQARILGAVLADQRGDLIAATAHLEHVDRLLHARDGGEASAAGDDGESALLLRQLAALHERQGRHDDAERCWQRILASSGQAPAYRAEHACFRLRRDDHVAAEAVANELLAGAGAAAPEPQRLLRDLAITAANEHDAEAGLAVLRPWRERLGITNRVLMAQLALAAGDPLLAADELARAIGAEPGNRAIRLLSVRTQLARQQTAAAEAQARTLVAEAQDDEEAATLLAESLAMRGAYAEALRVSSAATLPTQPGLERGLLHAFVLYEVHGVAHFLTALGRLDLPTRSLPLSRVIAAAFPGAWSAADAQHPVTSDDVLSVPPFPKLTRRLALALAGHGRRDLAAALSLSVAKTIAARLPADARTLRATAVPWLCRLGLRRAAWSEAWSARSWPALLRCCWPW